VSWKCPVASDQLAIVGAQFLDAEGWRDRAGGGAPILGVHVAAGIVEGTACRSITA